MVFLHVVSKYALLDLPELDGYISTPSFIGSSQQDYHTADDLHLWGGTPILDGGSQVLCPTWIYRWIRNMIWSTMTDQRKALMPFFLFCPYLMNDAPLRKILISRLWIFCTPWLHWPSKSSTERLLSGLASTIIATVPIPTPSLQGRWHLPDFDPASAASKFECWVRLAVRRRPQMQP